MEKQREDSPELGNLKSKVKIIFTSILGALLLLVDVYLMINAPENYISIALFSVLILGDLYLLITSILEYSYRKEQARQEQYEGIYKAEKASYMIFRKYFDALEGSLGRMEDKLDMPAEEIISAQKAVAKVTINRSKENTDALMSSNDKLIEKLHDLNTQTSRDSAQRQQELSAALRELELSIKSELYQAINAVALQPQVVVTQHTQSPEGGTPVAPVYSAPVQPAAPTPVPVVATTPAEEPVFFEEAAIEEPVIEDSLEAEIADEAIESMMAAELESDFVDEPIIETVPEPVIEAEPIVEPEVVEVPEPEPEPVAPAAPADPNAKMSDDDIAALFASMGAASEPAPEPEPEPEPVAPAAPADPNAKMSDDDIAALFASMGANSGSSDPIPEAAPAPAPVSSDPNKMMTPEEIEALFANM